MRKVLAISGSTRQHSSNHKLINAIAALTTDELDIAVYESIATLPHYNPDDDNEQAPETVKEFRRLLRNADGIIICTPEYAHGVPGSLKNAIDWTVSSSEFSHKPTALITASTDGRFGHNALLETLKVIEAENIDELHLVISFIKTKINADGNIIHQPTLDEVSSLIKRFINTIDSKKS
jgi:chromate reductase, NAD(P)H dehydrogenase (quinone)